MTVSACRPPSGGTAYHTVIEGDNLEALQRMQGECAGKFDFVYIDPPYNTGKTQNRNYKDRFWEYYSREKHEKWLDFMYRRFEALMPLLTDDAVVFVSIDDRELPHLILMLRRLFGEWNTEVMIWHKIPEAGTAGQGKMKRTKRFRIDHEYIIVAYRDKQAVHFNKIKTLRSVMKNYGNPDSDPRGPWISAEICKSKNKSNPNGKNYYTLITPSGRKITRQWHFSREELEELDRDGRIWWGNGRIIPRLKKFLNEPRLVTPSSVIKNISQTEGLKDLKKLTGKEPPSRPKPVRLLKLLLQMAARPDSLVLDFFAGTGSLGQAVMEYNAETGSRIRSVLVSNNEQHSLDDFLLPRLKKLEQIYLPEQKLQYFRINEH